MTMVRKEQGQDDYFNQQSKLLTLSANTRAIMRATVRKVGAGIAHAFN